VQASAGEPLLIRLGEIHQFEVSRGQKSRWLMGLGIGFVGGAAIGAVVGYTTDPEGNDLPPEGAAVIVGGLGAAVGGLLGTIIGSTIKSDRWEEVPLDRLRVGIATHRDGRLGIGLSLKF
jgi:hypothetical protein